MFTDKELFILSDGILRLIEDIGNAKRLVHEESSIAALDNEIKIYQELNTKITEMIKSE